MSFKDTPGLRRIASAAIEARDVVEVRLLPGHSFSDMDGVLYREGDVMVVARVHATKLVARGVVGLLD